MRLSYIDNISMNQSTFALICNFLMVFSSDIPYATDDGHSNVSSEPYVSELDMTSSEEEVQFDDHDEEWRLVAIGVEEADQVCVKLVVSKDRIFYKYLKDVIEIFYDPRHEYDQEVVEFFNTITYLGGRRTANMIRGPMYQGKGRGCFHDPATMKMNLGGPSDETCRKQQAGYTCKSGVIKSLSQAFLKLSSDDGISKTEPLIDIECVKVIPCVLANDGTALKPSIQFDPRTKENIGLNLKVDVTFVKENKEPTSVFLNKHIITEVLVSSLTSLDNTCSIPCAVDYVTKAGKIGEDMRKFFEHHCKMLQVCESCQDECPVTNNILSPDAPQRCESVCRECIESKSVCEECAAQGQISHHPSLRACKKCLETGRKCTRVAVLAIIVDCEEGNKQAMQSMLDSLLDDTMDPMLSLTIPLPDSAHVGKSLKGSFANWFLKLGHERGNLAILRTLRNKGDGKTKKEMRRFLPRNDHVRNKDRQDPSAVLKLTDERFIEFLRSLDFVVHTIIPETDRFTDNNKVGMYPHPISVSVGPYGSIFFLTEGEDDGQKTSSLYTAQLHNPVKNITLVKKGILSAKEVNYCESGSLVYLVGNDSPIQFIECEKGAVEVSLNKLRTHAELDDKLQRLAFKVMEL